MPYNAERALRMRQRTVAELIQFYKAKTLSSAAAAHELTRRGVALPIRE
jgi:hypothetical protein